MSCGRLLALRGHGGSLACCRGCARGARTSRGDQHIVGSHILLLNTTPPACLLFTCKTSHTHSYSKLRDQEKGRAGARCQGQPVIAHRWWGCAPGPCGFSATPQGLPARLVACVLSSTAGVDAGATMACGEGTRQQAPLRGAGVCVCACQPDELVGMLAPVVWHAVMPSGSTSSHLLV